VLEVGVAALDLLDAPQHQQPAAAYDVPGRCRVGDGELGPPLHGALESASQAGEHHRVLVQLQGQRGHRGADRVGCLVDHDLGQRVDAVGGVQASCDPGQPAQPVTEPTDLADLLPLADRVVDDPQGSDDVLAPTQRRAAHLGRLHRTVDVLHVETPLPAGAVQRLLDHLGEHAFVTLGEDHAAQARPALFPEYAVAPRGGGVAEDHATGPVGGECWLVQGMEMLELGGPSRHPRR
jgi:hypothetical protein